VHRELRRPNMTLALLWEEYRGGIGGQDGFGYSCYVAAQLMLRTWRAFRMYGARGSFGAT
jgi:hypothetical protein